MTTKSLAPIVDPSDLVQNSEYIETHLIVVPHNAKKDFLKTYETMAPMVVPRSAVQVAQDDEFVLFSVATFKKYGGDFVHKCREAKWTPRQYTYVEGGREEEQRELDRVTNEERKVCGEALRIGRTGWSESVMVWIHVLTLRVFVEAVLRYGLPLDYVTALVKVRASRPHVSFAHPPLRCCTAALLSCGKAARHGSEHWSDFRFIYFFRETQTSPKLAPKVKSALDAKYSYLGGNAFGRDKRGKIRKDDAALSSEMAAAGMATGEGNEYTAYVYYEMEIP